MKFRKDNCLHRIHYMKEAPAALLDQMAGSFLSYRWLSPKAKPWLRHTRIITKVTIRADLKYLDTRNLIKRTHGGAVLLKEKTVTHLAIDRNNNDQKNLGLSKEIATKALDYISVGECIILDSSVVCFELAKLIKESSLWITVLTNSINIAKLLQEKHNLTVIIFGGVINRFSDIEGILGIDILKKINVDKFFFSAHGLSLKQGLSDSNLNEVDLKKSIIDNSTRPIALVESNKFESNSVSTFTSLENLELLITNDNIPSETIEIYKDKVTVI